MDQPEKDFRKRFYVAAGCYSVAEMILVWGFIKGVLSIRGIAIVTLILAIAMYAAIFLVIRAHQRETKEFRLKQIASGVPAESLDRDRCIKSIRSLKRIIAFFAVLLIYGIVATRGGPLLARMAGLGFDVFVLVPCVILLIRSRKKLKELSSGSANAHSESN